MKFNALAVQGAYEIESDVFRDGRGYFARTFWAEDFEKQGLATTFAQMSASFNATKATLRGMHYQLKPFEEVKIVRCISGAIFDVVVDLRPESKTYCRWAGVELTKDNFKMLYVPEGCAHGFITLEDNTEILYQMSRPYSPDHYRGVRWNDPAFNIQWPLKPENLVERDNTYPDFLKSRA